MNPNATEPICVSLSVHCHLCVFSSRTFSILFLVCYFLVPAEWVLKTPAAFELAKNEVIAAIRSLAVREENAMVARSTA